MARTNRAFGGKGRVLRFAEAKENLEAGGFSSGSDVNAAAPAPAVPAAPDISTPQVLNEEEDTKMEEASAGSAVGNEAMDDSDPSSEYTPSVVSAVGSEAKDDADPDPNSLFLPAVAAGSAVSTVPAYDPDETEGEDTEMEDAGNGGTVAPVALRPLKDLTDKERRSEVKRLPYSERMIDANHSLYPAYSAIPLGDGSALTNVQIILLARVSAADRYARASLFYAKDKDALIYSKYRPDRPNPARNGRFDTMTRADFAAAGITWSDMPIYASGGAKGTKGTQKLVAHSV